MTDRQLLEQEALRVGNATRQGGGREGRRVLTEILGRSRQTQGQERTLALDLGARLVTLLRERDESRPRTARHSLWGN